jgi:hypothetical protein
MQLNPEGADLINGLIHQLIHNLMVLLGGGKFGGGPVG